MANKLYEETSIQEIADKIRLKNGKQEKLKVSQMASEIMNRPFHNIAEHHYAEAGRVINRILTLKQQYPNHIVFGTISDNHVDLSNADTIQSAKHATFALETVGKFAQCDFVANLGDNIVGTNIDDDTEYKNFLHMRDINKYALSNIPYFNLVGNHCKSNTTRKIYNIIGTHNVFTKSADTIERGFGYRDFTDKKVRVICLNTCDYMDIQGGNGMSYEQKMFLMEALDLSSKADYSSWVIIILSHIPLDFLGGNYNKSADLKAILKAYATGGQVSITVDSSYAIAQKENSKYSGDLFYSYEGINSPKVIHIHGHIHTNKMRDKLIFIDDNTEIAIPRLATHSSVYEKYPYSDRYTTSGDYSITASVASTIAKVPGTAKDTSATFYFIDLTGQKVYSIGYGSDIDRELVYSDIPKYSITYSLTDVTSSNSSLSILEGESYTTTLSVGTDYAIDTVKVTMGGADITSSAYSNGVVTITKVTGAIVITATAKDAYVPHWDIGNRTAVTDMNSPSGYAKDLSRNKYYWGATSTGNIDYRKITSCTVSGNNVTFNTTAKNYNIGLPYHLEPGASYKFSATASAAARLRVNSYSADGKSYTDLGTCSSGTSLTHTFTAPTDATHWTMVMLDNNNSLNMDVTWTNISLTKV